MKNMKFVFNILGMLLLLGAMPVWADSYEAPLPHQISSDPDMCAYAPCKEVIPGADSFSPRKGRPPYVEAYQTTGGQKKLLGYVFLSTDIVDIPAYSGKPVVTLIGMDTHGVFTGAKVLKHSEPILLLGIPESKLIDFIHQYVHKFVGDKVEIGKSHVEPGYVNLDAISGATVTVIAQNQVMMRCGLEIAKQVGIVKPKIRPPSGHPGHGGGAAAFIPPIHRHEFWLFEHALCWAQHSRRQWLYGIDGTPEAGRTCDFHYCQWR